MKKVSTRVQLCRQRVLSGRAQKGPLPPPSSTPTSACQQVEIPKKFTAWHPNNLTLGGPRRKSELKIQIEGVPEGRTHVEVLCFDLVYFTKPAQFVILSVGVFFFYLLYGYYQVQSLFPPLTVLVNERQLPGADILAAGIHRVRLVLDTHTVWLLFNIWESKDRQQHSLSVFYSVPLR